MVKEILEREEQKIEDTWDLQSLFQDEEAWMKEFERVESLSFDFVKYGETMLNSSKDLLDTLQSRDDLYRALSNLYTYSHLKLDEDTRKAESQALSDKAMGLIVESEERASFFLPALLEFDQDKLWEYVEEEEGLEVYRHFLSNLIRQQEHVLSAREESILAQMGEVASAPEKIYSMINNADLRFPKIKNEEGQEVELSHASFIPLMESKDREVRKEAFEKYYQVYKGFENTFAACLDGEIKSNIFASKLRKYDSTRQAAMNKNKIPLSVFDNLIKAVHDNLDSMYKYMEIRKRALGLDQLHMYDIYTPIVKDVEFKISYEDGVEMVKEALKPLGEDYCQVMDEGFSSRWIDIYQNRGKRSGAYSSGSYDSMPYILLNYQETLDNVFTLAHEMGHSIHSYFTRDNQPFVYGNYSIFLAEVASTANESLLLDYLMKKSKDKNEKLYLINHYLESFRTTVFRQTMFAEFEMNINRHLEEGGALTADYLNRSYRELNELYYGPDVFIDEEIASEWARIPHFYYNFYVYQYATGYAAVVDLSQRILSGQEGSVDKYLDFLKAGSSDYPIDVLSLAGVDMTTEEPVRNAMKIFSDLVDQLDNLI